MSQQNMLFSRLCASQHDLLLSISCKFHHWYLAPWFILAPRIKGKCLNIIFPYFSTAMFDYDGTIYESHTEGHANDREDQQT